MSFKEIKPEELNFNPFTRIGSDWMLLTAGTKDKFNTMTASWGGAGVFWGKPAVTCYIRPQRYTKEFIDKEDWICKDDAKDFLWEFLCDGIHISYTHYWLLEMFYKVMESLTEFIDSYKSGTSVSKKYLQGNWRNTEIKVEITE